MLLLKNPQFLPNHYEILLKWGTTGCSGSNWYTLDGLYGRLGGFLGCSLVPVMFTTLWHFVFYLTFPKKYSEGGSIELLKTSKNFKKFFHFFALKYLFMSFWSIINDKKFSKKNPLFPRCKGSPLWIKINFEIFYWNFFLQIIFLGKYMLFLANNIWHQPNSLARNT